MVPPVTSEMLAAARRDARDHGLLWRAEKDGRVSWLYGTSHLARMEWLMPGPTVRRALQDSAVLALELNPLDAPSMLPLSTPVDPAQAERVLTPARRARMARAEELACVPPGELDAMRPGLRAATLVALRGREVGLHAEYAMDTLLAVLASRQKKTIMALESASDQLALLAGSTDEEEGVRVDDALGQLESGVLPQMLNRLTRAWASGDEDTLASYAQWCQCAQSDADRLYLRRLLDERNGPMAEKIDVLHTGGAPVFAAVGALHMVGPQGLPALLRERGFTVQRVPADPPVVLPDQ